MHMEVLVEDGSGAKLIGTLLPKFIGPHGEPHTWRVHDYKGIGRLPRGLESRVDPAKATLLDRLPAILAAHGRSTGVDAVVVVVDSDQRNCRDFLAELNQVLKRCRPAPHTLFRLAIEETEAWLLGDLPALFAAYPRAKKDIVRRYRQDSVCGTWECLADAVHPGGATAIKGVGWPLPGQVKHEWVEQIAPRMDVERNMSPSFCKLRDGLRKLVA